MFTGIIESTATIQAIEKHDADMRLTIAHSLGLLSVGESIAVDGVCLTVTDSDTTVFHCQLSAETRRITTASTYQVGQLVNCERAMCTHDRFGGHIVTGHVDATLHITAIESQGDFSAYQIAGVAKKALGLLTEKGSVAINGVSLTINALTEDGFSVMLIPHTLSRTNLSTLKVNDRVNVEYDYLAKLVQRHLILSNQAGVSCSILN